MRHRIWDYVLPSRGVRVLIVLFPLLAAGEVVWSHLSGERAVSTAALLASLITDAAIVSMAWRPVWGAAALIGVGFAAVATGQGGEYLTAVAMSAGIVFYCCSAGIAAAYGIAAVAWVTVIVSVPPGLEVGGVVAVFIVGMLSASVGRGLRRVVRRNLALASQVDAHEAQLEVALAAERNRIADELHDVIAHEISIAVMHARVLERTDDPDTRSSSQRAIVTASTQALADTRRVLHLVHGRTGTAPIANSKEAGIESELESLVLKLRGLGHEVRAEVTGPLEFAAIIDSTLARAAREAVTNIVKHGGASARVDVSLSATPQTVILLVENTRGASRPGRSSGPSFGIARLRERIELLGGSFEAGSVGGGWRFRVALPTR